MAHPLEELQALYLASPPEQLSLEVPRDLAKRLIYLLSFPSEGGRHPDTVLLEWLLPLVTGHGNVAIDDRTLALGLAIMEGRDGRSAVQAAMRVAP